MVQTDGGAVRSRSLYMQRLDLTKFPVQCRTLERSLELANKPQVLVYPPDLALRAAWFIYVDRTEPQQTIRLGSTLDL